MFEFDYSDPEVRRILAMYEDGTARFESAATEITIEYQEQNEKIEDEHKKLVEQNREFYEQLAATEKPKQDEQSPWTAPQRETVMSFGDFDEEQKNQAWSTPTPPMGFPPPPPIPEPVPEPEVFRGAAPEPVMSFGSFDDDDSEQARTPPPPQAPGRRRARADDDDDDMSGQSWLR